MRKFQAVFSVLAIVLGFGALSGCGEDALAPKESSDTSKSPSQVAMLYVGGLGGDVAAVQAYNPDSSLTEASVQSMGAQAAEGLAKGLGVTFTPAQLAAAGEAYTNALGRVEAEAVDEKTDGDQATVTLEVRGVDLASALAERTAALQPPAAGSEAATYLALLVDSLDGAELVDEPVSFEMTLNRSRAGLWSPDSAAGRSLIQAMVRWG
jgi:hypothetical protein